MIGIVSGHAVFCKAVERLLQSEERDDILLMPPDLGQIKNRLAPSAPLILDAHLDDTSGNGKGGLTLIRRLRSDPTWRYVGPILVLVYAPATLLGQWSDAEVLDTKGITVLRMPFMVAELQASLASAPLLSEGEWDDISRRLGLKSFADRAGELGHKYEGAFGPASSALKELQKLKGFSTPDFQKARAEIGTVQSRITEEWLSRLSTDLKTLHAEGFRLALRDKTCSGEKLDIQIAQVRQDLALLNLDAGAGKLDDIFWVAGEIRTTLGKLLASFRAIKEKATQEVKDGS